VSFDIVVLKPTQSVSSLTEVEDAEPLGTPTEIREASADFFAGLVWSSARDGSWSPPEGFVVEFQIAEGERPQSLHLSLHFGPNWTDATSDDFHNLVQRLFDELGWQAFAVSDNSPLFESPNA